MFLELIATFTIGLGTAGLVLLVGKLSRGALPRWTVPAMAGLGMIGFTIWSEYTWFDRTAEQLPEGVVVARINEDSKPWRPWSYAVPQVNRFVAVDRASIRSNDAQPGQIMVDLYLLGRWRRGATMPVLLDCPGHRRATLTERLSFGPEGAVQGADWTAVPPDDPVLVTACEPVG